MSNIQPPAPGSQPPPPAPRTPTKSGMSTGKILLIVGACMVGFFLIVGVGCTALVAGSMSNVAAEPSVAEVSEIPTEAPPPAPSTETPTTEAAPTTAAPKPAPKAAPKPAPKPKPAPTTKAPPPEPQLTRSQENAIGSALSYLETSGFSRKGLVDQLSSEYGDNYKKADAEFAVEFLEKADQVDWNAEAVESAESYLETSNFSCDGLVDQLSSEYGDQYTKKQAQYAAKKVRLC